jgi:hypothetical protein
MAISFAEDETNVVLKCWARVKQWRGVTRQKKGDSKRATLPAFKKDEVDTHFESLTLIIPPPSRIDFSMYITKMTSKGWTGHMVRI